MKVLCNLTTKKIIGFSRWDDLPHDPEFYAVVDVNHVPDTDNERLNDTNDALRAVTQIELDADSAIKLDELADIENQFNEPLKAFSLVVLSEINILRVEAGLPVRTVQQLKDAVKTRL